MLLAVLLAPAAPPAGAQGWLTYDRSGGITGWSLKATVDRDGSVRVVGTRQDPAAVERAPLAPEELAELRGLVARALDAPPRKALPGTGRMADAMQRILSIQGPEGDAILLLSDGLRPAEVDRRLVAALEALASRPPAGTPSRPPPEPPAGPAPAGRLDVVTVAAPGGGARGRTALLVELPVGRGQERAGAEGAIELLLLAALGPQSRVLLDGEPPVEEPGVGDWSLSITPARTRLLVEVDASVPASVRAATARIRALLGRRGEILPPLDAGAWDHHRRRLAAAVRERASHPRARRADALRAAAWGEAARAPDAFSVHAITRGDLQALAARLRSGHARLVTAGPLAPRVASLVARGGEIRPRAALEAPVSEPGAPEASPPNERLIALPASGPAAGRPAVLALQLAQRRLGTAWTERVEPGAVQQPVAGDTLAVVTPAPGLEDGRLARRLATNLRVLSRGLQQSVVDARLRRRALASEPREAAARALAAADALELGAPHPGSEPFDLASAPPEEGVRAEQVRAAAAALAESLRELPPPTDGGERPAPLLEAARRALFGELGPEELRGATIERRGLGPDGAARRLSVSLEPGLPLRSEGPGDPFELDAARLPAGDSPAARREQGLVAAALADPALLVAGAATGRLPWREAGEDTLAEGERRRPVRVLEVLVPARGAYRLLVDDETGDPLAVDRPDPLGRTIRVRMSDIRPDDSGRRRASRLELLRPDGGRELLLEGVIWRTAAD